MALPINSDTDIVVTCGATEAMMAALLAVTDPGDKVIIFSPFYENYGADCLLSAAEPIYVPLTPPDYHFDPEQLEAAFRQGAKVLILCNPSNPCGKVFSRDELTLIADLVERYDAYVITDEVYEHIVYAPYRHIYFAALPGMWQRTISVGSLSKTYSITGWRLGYTIAAEAISERIRKVHDFLTVGAAAPLQEAIVPALEFPSSYYEDLTKLYTSRKKLFLDGLDQLSLIHNDPQGAYYVMLDISQFKGYANDLEFCETLAAKVGVGAVPCSIFFREREARFIRLHFAKKEETLYAALERLKSIHQLM